MSGTLPSIVWESWRGITWRMAGWTIVAGLTLWVIWVTTHQGFFIFLHDARSGNVWKLLGNIPLTQLFAFVFLLCILPAELAVNRGAPRIRSYLLAIVTAALLLAAIDWSIKEFLGTPASFKWWWRSVDGVWIFLTVLFLGGPATFVYTDWQRARRTSARLHAAGLARTGAARDILQTRLQSMQARVDPRFLFDTLARVRHLYERDSTQGERTLDALIAYLRTAMPRMRDVASTLARECDLARAYVEIVSARGDARLRLQIVTVDDAPRIAFPSMLLLPLVELAVARSRTTPLDDNKLELRADVDGTRLRVSLVTSNGALADADAGTDIHNVRDRLQTLFGTDARIELHERKDGCSEVVVEVPCERR